MAREQGMKRWIAPACGGRHERSAQREKRCWVSGSPTYWLGWTLPSHAPTAAKANDHLASGAKRGSNLFGAFPVKQSFLVCCRFLVRSGKEVSTPAGE